MIRYALQCTHGHGFEAWFRSSADYDAQAKGKLLSCPSCGSADVNKALMAPAVAAASGDKSTSAVLLGDKEQKLRAMLRAVRDEVTKNAENVGPRFAEVARQMHDGDLEKSSVYGVATADEARSLVEDGIEFHPIPAMPDKGN